MTARKEIEAAVAAYNATDPDMRCRPRPRSCSASCSAGAAYANAACPTLQRKPATLRTVKGLLRILTQIGFLTTEHRIGAVPTPTG
jgi:hypothetical protein